MVKSENVCLYWVMDLVFLTSFKFYMGFPGGADSEKRICLVSHQGWEDPLEEEMATHSSTLA